MHVDVMDEWRRFSEQARATMRAGSRAPSNHQPVMKVVTLPSFKMWCRYELFASRSDPNQTYVVAYSTWDREEDLKRFDNLVERSRQPMELEPTIRRQSAVASADAARQLLESMAKLAIPPLPTDARAGVDGTTVELTFGALFTELRVRWWQTPPTGWEPLGRGSDELMGLVLRSIAQGGVAVEETT